MTDKVITLVENPPAAFEAGSPEEYGQIDLQQLTGLIDLAANAHNELGEADDPESLRQGINDLSDAVRNLAGQVYQVGIAARSGRIAVVGLEQL